MYQPEMIYFCYAPRPVAFASICEFRLSWKSGGGESHMAPRHRFSV